MAMPPPAPRPPPSPWAEPRQWQRVLWTAAGCLALALGIVGAFLPLLPTTPLVLLAAWCFSKGSARFERWLLDHPRFGPMVRGWRAHRVVPRRAKALAFVMMAASSLVAWWFMPRAIAWLPGAICLAVAVWMWRLPSQPPALPADPAAPAEPVSTR
jgi:uncharacterized protein